MNKANIQLDSRGGFLFLPVEHNDNKSFLAAFVSRVFLAEEASEFINFGFSGTIDGAAGSRKKLCDALKLNFENLTCGEQVHGTKVAVVDKNTMGSGALEPDTRIPATDALVTNIPGVPLAVMTADCVPVFYVDEVGGAIGAAHAGWRSALNGIAEKTLDTMSRSFGTKPENVRAYLGPSIGTCCFQVHEDVTDMLKKNETKHVRRDGDKTYLDLRAVIAGRLMESGIMSVVGNDVCTCCNTNLFFSHRGDKKFRGSNISVISITG